MLSTEFKVNTTHYDMALARPGQTASTIKTRHLHWIAIAIAATSLSSCGTFHSSGSGVVSGSHIAASAARISSSTASLAPHTGQSSAGKPWLRHSPNTPAMVVRALHHDTSAIQQMLKDQEDVFISYKGWRRLGNGSLSLRFENERGKRLRCHESGGRVFIEAPAGSGYRLLMRNETDVRIEVVVAIDGMDLGSLAPGAYSNSGIMIEPRGNVEVRRFRSPDGKEVPLTFAAPVDLLGGHDYSAASRPGTLVLAVFHHAAEDLFDIRRTADRRTGREFPQRQTVPVPKPYQYR